jgi:hypothetical protein
MDQKLLHSYLRAETAGRDADAEAALARLFGALPGAVPSAGFAGRVVRAAGLAPAPWSWPARAAVAVGLALTGAAAAYLPLLLFGLGQLIRPGELLDAAVGALVGLVHGFVELLSAGHLLARIGEALWLAATSPPVGLGLLALITLATLAFRWLTELLTPQRSVEYV